MHRLKWRDVAVVKEVLPKVHDAFLDPDLQEASNYFEKSRQGNCPEETLKEADWEVVEFQISLQQRKELHLEIENRLANITDVFQAGCFSSFIYSRNIFKKERTAATRVLVLMLPGEKRSKEPYVSYVPCRTLKDQYIGD